MDFKTHSSQFEEIAHNIYPLLGWGPSEDRKACLIAIDGEMGAGKTHLANWLAWQFGAVAIHADLYWKFSVPDFKTMRKKDLAATLSKRLLMDRLAIFEGIYSFKILNLLGFVPNYKIIVAGKHADQQISTANDFHRYYNKNKSLADNVNFTLPVYEK